MGKAEREQMQNSARALEEPSRFVQYFKEAVKETRDDLGKPWDYVYGALQDIHRRVFEEGWFGKTVHDVVEHHQYNPRDPNPHQRMRDDQNTGKDSPHDYSPAAFYGQNQEKEQQQDAAMQEEDDLGMER